MALITIKTDSRYANWLAKHLSKEHPKTRNKIKIRKLKKRRR